MQTSPRGGTQCSYVLRICTNKTCSRQGSRQILQFVRDLALPHVQVQGSGCLGLCGNGPNVVIMPLSQIDRNNTIADQPPTIMHHMSTPAKLAEAIATICGIQVDAVTLRCTELRLAGNAAALDGHLQRAIQMYSEALTLNPPHGRHLILANRSAAQLASGSAAEALDDARAAVSCSPPDFTTAAVRLADALFALGRHEDALIALQAGGQQCPSWLKTQEYRELEEHVRRAIKSPRKIRV